MINIIGLLLIYKINGYLASSYHIHRNLQLKIAVCTILTVCFMLHRVFSNVYTRKCIAAPAPSTWVALDRLSLYAYGTIQESIVNCSGKDCWMCVTDLPALRTQRAVCTVKFVKSLARWQHLFDVEASFLSYPAPLSLVQIRPKCNQFNCCW